jgi:hypothetical protein
MVVLGPFYELVWFKTETSNLVSFVFLSSLKMGLERYPKMLHPFIQHYGASYLKRDSMSVASWQKP